METKMKLTQMLLLLELLLLLLLLYVFNHVLLQGREAPPLEIRNKYIQQKQQQYLDKTRLVALIKQSALIKQLFALIKQLLL